MGQQSTHKRKKARAGTKASGGAAGLLSGAALSFDLVCLSDIHLLSDYADPRLLLEFLTHARMKKLILVGDIVDIWYLKDHPDTALDEIHARVMDAFLDKAASGTEIIYVIGNHDEVLREAGHFKIPLVKNKRNPHADSPHYLGEYCGITLKAQHTEVAPDGKKTLYIHGDDFDPVLSPWISHLGERSYSALMKLNAAVNGVMPESRAHHWSLARWIKKSVKKGLHFTVKDPFSHKDRKIGVPGIIDDFEGRVAAYAREAGLARVVCGHIHAPEDQKINGVHYINTGDFVDNCSFYAVQAGQKKGGIVKWPIARTALGFSRLPKASDDNLFAAQRYKTTQFFNYVFAQWGAERTPLFPAFAEAEERQRKATMKALNKKAGKIYRHLLSLTFLRAAREGAPKPKAQKKLDEKVDKHRGKLEKHGRDLTP